MTTLTSRITGLMFALVASLILTAAAVAQEAKIVKIIGTGSAIVSIAGQDRPAQEAMAVPLNAEIRTTGQEVYLEVVAGVVATVKPNSVARVENLSPSDMVIELRRGSLVTQIDKKRNAGKSYKVRTARGVAAARGTSFSVSVTDGGMSIAATADTITFTAPNGATFTIQAGMISITQPGQPPSPPVPLAAAAATNSEVAGIVRDAVQTVSTVIQNNLGQISAESATNLVAQVVAVAVTAIPTEATTFTATAVAAVTASGSATSTSADAAAVAAGAVTAAAVEAAPTQAAQIAGAAAQAAPAQSGVITAAALQTAPAESATAIVENVATSTGQSTTTVQNNATAAQSQATQAVNTANEATSNITTQQTQQQGQTQQQQQEQQQQQQQQEQGDTTPQTPEIDPTVSPSS